MHYSATFRKGWIWSVRNNLEKGDGAQKTGHGVVGAATDISASSCQHSNTLVKLITH